jgi:hypothetical protein
MGRSWETYKVDVPAGKAGDWEIRIVDLDMDKDWLWFIKEGMNGRSTPPGRYTILRRGNVTVMSDTRAEIQDHMEAMIHTDLKGEALILGLGLGMVANGLLVNNPDLKVTVIEKSADVIALVQDHYKAKFGDRFNVIHADAFEWKPPKGTRYALLWGDIWDTITSDNLPEMAVLHRRFKADWKGSWAKDLCKQMRNRFRTFDR